MNLTLTTNDYLSTGVFGTIEAEDESFELKTLEHAYPVTPDIGAISTTFEPKIARGITYLCVRGMHTLEHHPVPFEAFEITGVPDFHGNPVTKCLLHIGNFNRDTEGCVLVGLCRAGNASITQSVQAFELLMQKQAGIDQFYLKVI